MASVEEAEEPKRITAKVDPGFPEIVGIAELREVPSGNCRHVLDQTENPGNLLSLFAVEGIKEILDRALAGLRSVESDFSPHAEIVHLEVNIVKSVRPALTPEAPVLR